MTPTATKTRPAPQQDLYDATLEDDELVRQLDVRQTAKEKLDAARMAFAEKDELVKGRLKGLAVTGRTRIGNYLITVTPRPARTVDPFEVKAATVTRISLIDAV